MLSKEPIKNSSIGDLVRKMESDYTKGNVTISKYVTFDMYDTINTIEAYLNSKHIKGEYDSLNREKPFFNIVVAASNIWYRATDIDRRDIKIKATKGKDVIGAFLATIHLQYWMNKIGFGQFLNEWGRVLARYGSAITKFVENSDGLFPFVVPWNRSIVDTIDFDPNAKIEVLELTEGQLRKEAKKKGYDKEVVSAICDARKARETLDKRKKDNKSEYIKVYEVRGELPLSYLTHKPEDEDEYVQQMHVITFVKSKNKSDYDDYTLFAGKQSKEPSMITHLIKEDGRTLSIGSVEHLFQSQWMANHSVKAIKDQLDLASKLIFQTADGSFVGQNALTSIETGDILIHGINMPLEQVNNTSHDTVSLQNFMSMWKSLGNEITGVSEAMLGATPKSGTAWRQTQALLQENYSLFELMTENKGLYIEQMLREYIIPYIKKQMGDAKEIAATLKNFDIDWIDSKYIKNFSIKESNRIIKDKVLRGETPTQDEQMMIMQNFEGQAKSAMKEMGNQRFFKPSEISTKTWRDQLKDLEWEVEIDVTGENKDYQSVLATLNTALQVVASPGYDQNKKAQLIVDKILQATGQLSPLEISTLRSESAPAVPMTAGSGAGVGELAVKTQ